MGIPAGDRSQASPGRNQRRIDRASLQNSVHQTERGLGGEAGRSLLGEQKVLRCPWNLRGNAQVESISAAKGENHAETGGTAPGFWAGSGCVRHLPEIHPAISRLPGSALHLSKAAAPRPKARPERGDRALPTRDIAPVPCASATEELNRGHPFVWFAGAGRSGGRTAR